MQLNGRLDWSGRESLLEAAAGPIHPVGDRRK